MALVRQGKYIYKDLVIYGRVWMIDFRGEDGPQMYLTLGNPTTRDRRIRQLLRAAGIVGTTVFIGCQSIIYPGQCKSKESHVFDFVLSTLEGINSIPKMQYYSKLESGGDNAYFASIGQSIYP